MREVINQILAHLETVYPVPKCLSPQDVEEQLCKRKGNSELLNEEKE